LPLLWKCGNRAIGDFQKGGKRWENRTLVSSFFHGLAVPQGWRLLHADFSCDSFSPSIGAAIRGSGEAFGRPDGCLLPPSLRLGRATAVHRIASNTRSPMRRFLKGRRFVSDRGSVRLLAPKGCSQLLAHRFRERPYPARCWVKSLEAGHHLLLRRDVPCRSPFNCATHRDPSRMWTGPSATMAPDGLRWKFSPPQSFPPATDYDF